MPLPPPPPPAPGPPRGGFKPPTKSGGGAVDRNALLSSIQKGATLKKTVTNDRSSPVIDGKVSKPSANGPMHSGGSSGGGMANGGAPQLGGLFAGGMPKLRPTGRGRNTPDTTDSGPLKAPNGGTGLFPGAPRKPSAPLTPPGSAKPHHSSNTQLNHASDHHSSSPSNGYLPPSPKPSSKSNPAPPPPPSNRKPLLVDRGLPGPRAQQPDAPHPPNKLAPPRPMAEQNSSSQNGERHPPLPMKPPSFKARPEPGYRGAPPRPPSSSKPLLPPKSPDLKPDGETRRTSIDRSVSLREPYRPPVTQTRVGTSAESPAAAFRVNTNHREAPPIPSSRPPLSKTVGRTSGAKLLSGLRPPSDRPPKPPQRPVVAAPPPPSQPPPPPPSHRIGATPTPTPGGKADVPLPPIPHSPVPPLPPERNESTRTLNHRQPGEFESRFSNLFKSRAQFPLPLTYNNVPKIYPSKNNALPFFLHQSYLDLHSMQDEAKNQRRAPLPPTTSQPQSQTSNNNNNNNNNHINLTSHSQSTFTSGSASASNGKPSSHPGYNPLHSFTHGGVGNPPPPPPPHAPLHLQMDRKFYGTEASHC